jgi:hypothetical protein
MRYGSSTVTLAEGGLLQLDPGEWWLLALLIGTVVLVVVAVLLGLVIALLQRIDRHAARVFTVGKQISENTVALWTLEQTNRDLVAIRDAARSLAPAVTTKDRTEGTGLGGAKEKVADKVQGWLGGSEDPGEAGAS